MSRCSELICSNNFTRNPISSQSDRDKIQTSNLHGRKMRCSQRQKVLYFEKRHHAAEGKFSFCCIASRCSIHLCMRRVIFGLWSLFEIDRKCSCACVCTSLTNFSDGILKWGDISRSRSTCNANPPTSIIIYRSSLWWMHSQTAAACI